MSAKNDVSGVATGEDMFEILLEYEKPYCFDKLLGFLRFRTLVGVELIDDVSYSRAISTGEAEGWLRVENDGERGCLVLTMSDGLAPVANHVEGRIRRLFDLDCEPDVVAEGIASLDGIVEGAVVCGTRMPGAIVPFEIACRAILGQQVSVVAANKFAARIVASFGKHVETGIEGMDKVFPTAEEILEIDRSHEGGIEGAFGELGVIATRSRCIAEVARMVADGELDFSGEADAEEQIERLVSVKGIGPWTANYIAMRALGFTDAFLETDVGIKHALPDLTPRQRLEVAEQWRPWRSYANISLWNSLG